MFSCIAVFTLMTAIAQDYGSYYDDYYEDTDDEESDRGDDGYYDENQKQHEQNDEVKYVYNQTQVGDQMLRISVAGNIPTNFGNPLPGKDGQMKLGGLVLVGYHYFLTNFIAVGADIGFGFNSTKANNLFNHVPIIATATVQPSIQNFEFPVSVGAGLAWETYSSKTYWPGLVLKAEAGVRYKIKQGWSVGADVSYTYMPQFGNIWDSKKKNTSARFVTVAASVSYYF